MTPEREKLIRDTWADRRRWISGWNVTKHPRCHVAPARPLTIPPPDPDPDQQIGLDILTFEYERGVKRRGEHGPGEPWERITCEGIVLEEGPRQ